MKEIPSPSPRKRWWKNLLVAGLVLLAAILLVYVFRFQILTGLAEYLTVEDSLHPADLILVLNGDYNTRPFYASDLYHQGLAPIIAIARVEPGQAERLGLIPNETDISVGVMERQGVPPDKIVVLTMQGGVTSTFDESELLRQYVETHAVKRVILVTSAFHTRRARWIFERALEGTFVTLEMAAVPYPTFDQSNWWRSEGGLIALNNEYIKLVYYFFKYR